LVFILGVVREEWRREREEVGILRLLLAEIEYNVAVVQTLEHWKTAEVVNIDMRLLPHLKVEVWHSVRVRAAQLLPAGLTMTLNDYYSPLGNLISLREVQEDPKKLDLSNHLTMNTLTRLAERKYTGPPILYMDYAILALDAQNVAHSKIADGLALPWWRRYPLTGRVVDLVASAFRSRKGTRV
jgi:hypothetical protein